MSEYQFPVEGRNSYPPFRSLLLHHFQQNESNVRSGYSRVLLPGIGYETLTTSSSFLHLPDRIMDNLPTYVIMQLAQEKAILLTEEDGVRNKRLSSPLLSPTLPDRVA
jgi:hypothetical protein